METIYRKSHYLFLILTIICFAGFYKTYFGSIKAFSNVNFLVHLHAIAVIIWLILLIIQPILINQKKLSLHRTIGKATYFFVPLVIILMLLMERSLYQKLELQNTQHNANLAGLFGPFTNTFPFLIFYILAIKNKKFTSTHAKYMIGTGFALLSSAVWRLFHHLFGLNLFLSFTYAILLTILIIVIFGVYDFFKGNRKITSPFVIIFLVYFIPNLLSLFVPNTAYWQNFAQWLVGFF